MKIDKTFREWFLDSLKKGEEVSDYKHPLEIKIKQRDWEWAIIPLLLSVYVVVFVHLRLVDVIPKAWAYPVLIVGFGGIVVATFYAISKVEYYQEYYEKFQEEYEKEKGEKTE